MIVPLKFSNLKIGPERRRVNTNMSRLQMPTEGGDPGGDGITNPIDLRYVGPATAQVIEDAPFSPSAIHDREISYSELLEAGVNSGVAGKLRREYSLVWAFDWVTGAYLEERANQVGGLDPEQRRWIASSPRSEEQNDPGEVINHAEQAWRDRAGWIGSDDRATDCDRCGDPLVTYRLQDQRTHHCESCGYVGLAVQS